MKIRLKILVICCCPIFTFGQAVRSQVKSLVDSIASYNALCGLYIGDTDIKSSQCKCLNRLTNISTSKELLDLTKSTNTLVKCAAFQALCAKDSIEIIPVLRLHLYDTSLVSVRQGCFGWRQMTGDYFLQTFYYFLATKDSTYFVKNHANLVAIDSLLFYDPKIRLAYKEGRIKGTNGDPLYYDRVRDIALNERVPVSVIALAKYKKQQDKEIIESYFANDKTLYHAIWAVREFPDPKFYPFLIKVFEEKWRHKRYSYPTWRILYQALAQYPNNKTLALFDKTIGTRNKFRRETLGMYLAIAITKYPNPLFDKYQNKIQVYYFHKEFLNDEANLEN